MYNWYTLFCKRIKKNNKGVSRYVKDRAEIHLRRLIPPSSPSLYPLTFTIGGGQNPHLLIRIHPEIIERNPGTHSIILKDRNPGTHSIILIERNPGTHSTILIERNPGTYSMILTDRNPGTHSIILLRYASDYWLLL